MLRMMLKTETSFNCYLTGIKAAMKAYVYGVEDFIDMNKMKIYELYDKAGENLKGNYPTPSG